MYHFETLRHTVESGDHVTCPHCGALIEAASIRCRECGVHFSGHAYEFSPEERATRAMLPWMRIVGLAALTVFVALIGFALVALLVS